jgi:predicted molibdopterin-dependent oxidoreductase YjgC
MNRIIRHPILGDLQQGPVVLVYFNGEPLIARQGETVASALVANGVVPFRKTEKMNTWRGIFCAIGRCTDCAMTIDGVPNTRTCVTTVQEGMKIEMQDGLGEWKKA